MKKKLITVAILFLLAWLMSRFIVKTAKKNGYETETSSFRCRTERSAEKTTFHTDLSEGGVLFFGRESWNEGEIIRITLADGSEDRWLKIGIVPAEDSETGINAYGGAITEEVEWKEGVLTVEKTVPKTGEYGIYIEDTTDLFPTPFTKLKQSWYAMKRAVRKIIKGDDLPKDEFSEQEPYFSFTIRVNKVFQQPLLQ